MRTIEPDRGTVKHPTGADAQRVFEAATAAHNEARLDDAERLYLAVLQQDRNHAAALHGLGLLRAQQGRFGDAIKNLRRAVERAPRSADAHNDLGTALQAANRGDEALARYRKALTLEPSHAGAHYNLGCALQARGDVEAAVSHFVAAVVEAPHFVEALANLGSALQQLGRGEEACAAFERALAVNPGLPAVHCNLGVALGMLGREQAAVACFERAIAADPGFAEAHLNLGTALRDLGRVDDAMASLKRAIAARPGYADAHNNLGVMLQAAGNCQAAITEFERALAATPDRADIHNNLGTSLATLNRDTEAIACYERALALDPHDADAHTNLGTMLLRVGRHAEAHAQFGRALALRPENAAAHNLAGEACIALQREADAVVSLERAVALDPGLTRAHSNLSHVYQRLGRLADAHGAARRAIELSPGDVKLHAWLATCKRFAPGDPDLLKLEAFARDADALPVVDRTVLHFALAKAYEETDEPARAFDHLLAGNALKRGQIRYDEAAELGVLERTRTLFEPALIERFRGTGPASDTPIFVIGMPRSGTTLVEQVLASHPAVFGAGELDVWTALTKRHAGGDPSRAYPELLASLSPGTLRGFGADYLAATRDLAPTAGRIIDKMPGNYLFAGLIHLALPGARIIHVQRDPVDTCLSCFATEFADGQFYAYDLGELGRYYRAYQALMAHWRALLPAEVMLEVRYEDVVADIEREARRLVGFCGLPWDDACLAFHTNRRPVRTASVSQVRQPIYRGSVGRWRRHGDRLAPLLGPLGIDPTG